MEKRGILNFTIILLLFGGLLIFLYLAQGKITGFSVFEQSNPSNFDEGTYNNANYNGSAVVLNSGQTSGNYISKIFDAGINSTWNNLSWTGGLPDVEFIFATDNKADVWKSPDSGITWSLVKDDYNGVDGNGVTASFFNSLKDYFIIYKQDVWTSNDLGISWTKINEDYNGGAEGQKADVSIIDNNNYIYIIERDQDVWKSTDSGATFTKATTDFNEGNGKVLGFVSDNGNNLYAVDAQSDVWKSSDSGTTWSLVKDDYNAEAENNTNIMAIDSNNILYVLDLQNIWSSSDLGISWTKINEDFNGAGDSENSKSIITDSNNYIYVIDDGQDVFKSVDSGITFSKVSTNFNGGNGNVPTMAEVIQNTNLSFQVKVCSLSDCSDGIWQNSDLSNLALYGRYFQYSVNFSTPDSGTTPYLKSVSIDYTINNSAPSLILLSPINGGIYSNLNISFNFSISDLESNLNSCWYEFSGVNYSISDCKNASFNILKDRDYRLIVYSNDSFNYLNFSEVTFTLDTTAPNLTINSPTSGTYGTSTILFNATSIDATTLVDSCWYSINSGTTNRTLSKDGTTNFYNFTQTSVADNSYTTRFYCNDSANNVNNTENVAFTVSTSSGSSSGGGGEGLVSLKESNNSTEILEKNATSNNFSKNLIREQTEISLIDANRRKSFVDAEYVIKNLADEDREINLFFTILNSNEFVESEIEESHFIPTNSEKTFGISIPVDKNLNEKLILIIDFKKYSSSSIENTPIRSLISGLAIVNAEKNKKNLSKIIILSSLFFIFISVLLYKLIKKRKKK